MIKLSNVFVRELWTQETILETIENTDLLSSGVFTSNPLVARKVNSEDSATKIQIPVILENSYSEPDIMDDSDNDVSIEDISKAAANAIVGFYAKSYAEKSIVKQLGSGIDPLEAAGSLVAKFWTKDIFNRALSMLSGAVADNKANDGSDAVLTIDTVIDYNTVIDAIALSGEDMDGFSAIVMHPKTKAALKKADANGFVKMISETGFELETYNGLTVFTSSKVPYDSTNDRYTTYILKNGAFTFEMANVDAVGGSVETFRDPRSGKGAGQDQLIVREGYLLHLNGYDFVGANVANPQGIPTISELADASNWDRLVDVEHTPFVAIEAKV
jgi:hypothetical protein